MMVYMEKQPIWTVFWAKIPQTGYSVCLGRRATGGPGGGGAPRQWAAREADYGGKASISVRSSLQWAEGTTSATIKRTTLSYTYLGYIKYPTYPVQCSKTAVFSGLEWNFWFEKIYFFEKNLWNDSSDTCDNLHICCETYWICRFTTIFCSVLVTLRWSFDVPFFALELLHAEKLSATIFLCKLWGSLHMNYKLALVF